MQHDHRQRVLIIAFIIASALWCIFPGGPKFLLKPFFPNMEASFTPNLKPGIDMVGGTSLVYQIIPPEGVFDSKLSEQVATNLKKRVDPDGVKNLVWRPLGPTRLEIQMPLSPRSQEGAILRDAYVAAGAALDKTNVRVLTVVDDLTTKTGAERDERIKFYAQDSAERVDILNQLKTLADGLSIARAKQDAETVGKLRVDFEDLQTKLTGTNLNQGRIESLFELTVAEREDRLAKLKEENKNFPSRLKAIDNFIAAYNAFNKVRDLVDDTADLKRKLRGSGVLSFHILADDLPPFEMDPLILRLQQDGPKSSPGDRYRWFKADRPEEFHSAAIRFGKDYYVLAYVDPERSMMKREGSPNWGLSRAYGDNHDGQLAVGFQFDVSGSKMFGDLTGRWNKQGQMTRTTGHNYRLGIVLDGKIISAPEISSPIYGQGVISGGHDGFSKQDQQYLISTLGAGSAPAQLTDEPISEITVGPQLGADNLKAGFLSCLLGLVIVTIFMITYYYLSGLVAVIAVFINLLLVLGSMAMISATFTLPGVAGIVLSVAMAVDANVLIFERLREEQSRGLSLKMALHNSYDRALSAILDANITTAISCAGLYWFGSDEVKGFGLTLLLGIACSLFTSLYVTKTIFGILTDQFGLDDLGSLPRTFKRLNEVLTPSIDWVGKSWLFVTFSAVFVIGGLTCWGLKLYQGQALDIEFSGGTSVRLVLTKDADRESVQQIVDKISLAHPKELAAPRVVSVGNDARQFEVSTPTTDAKAVQSVILDALRDQIDVPAPSKFENVGVTYAEAEKAGVVIPIENRQQQIPGLKSATSQEFVGGAAILLKNVQPRLTVANVKDRLDQRMLQEDTIKRLDRVEVEELPSNDGIVVFVSDPRYAYNPADQQALASWVDSLAGPAWRYVNDAVFNPPQLKGVTSFNAQVAEEAMYNTIMALSVSVLGIMSYIWIRFGNLKFGTATVVACIHDAAFVMAAIGFSLYVGQLGFFEKVLLVKPFRLDLTLVAAVLTVVGYSMNDTVVIFDRIRENRGKFGAISRQVINDSINQTMSRTILTGGTSIGILMVMYFLGGDGIHGFTFVMLLGIIVGTYSSIAIAAPVLLIGGEEKVTRSRPAPVKALG